MWPMLLDMTRDECKRMLRKLELASYSATVSALRAQGSLTKDRKKLLQDLAAMLNISTERHRAEIRRAVNDEYLATVADHMEGPNTSTEWAIEGRRLIPLMPRLVPQTAFTSIANNVANKVAAENAKLPAPSTTARKPGEEIHLPEPGFPEASKTPQRALSPANQGVPSGGGEPVSVRRESDDSLSGLPVRKRFRSNSFELPPPPPIRSASPASTLASTKMPAPPIPAPPSARTVTIPVGLTPMKITLTSTPTRATVTPTTTAPGTSQKVIIVSSSGNAGAPSILQRSLSVPVVKTVSATGTSNTVSSNRGGAHIINSGPQSSASGQVSSSGNIVTITTGTPGSNANITATTVSIGGIPTAAYITSQANVAKIRSKTLPLPTKPRPRTSSIVIPVTPNQQSPAGSATGVGGGPQSGSSVSSLQSIHLKASNVIQTGKGSVHIKSESGGMKTMSLAGLAGTTKILPKPNFSAGGGGGASVYVVTTTAASTSSLVTRTVSSGSVPRVVTVSAGSLPRGPATHIRPTSGSAPSTIVSLNQSGKTLQTVHVGTPSQSSAPTSGSTTARPPKPNVIVLQKGGAALSRGVLAQGGKLVGKVLMGKQVHLGASQTPVTAVTLQKPGTAAGSSGSTQTLNLPVSATQGNVIVLDISHDQLNKNSVLADILQATGLLGDGATLSETLDRQKKVYTASDWLQMDTEETRSVHATVGTSSPQVTVRSNHPETSSGPIHTEVITIPANQVPGTVGEVSPIATVIAEATQAAAVIPQAQISLREVRLPIDLAEGQMVTLEEAMELLGRSDSEEARSLLRQAGIEISDAEVTSTETHAPAEFVAPTSVTVHHTAEEHSGNRNGDIVTPESKSAAVTMEVVGELDPQTGVYSVHPVTSESSADVGSTRTLVKQSEPAHPEPSGGRKSNVPPSTTMDIFSTALASADIHLDPFQYIEEEMASTPSSSSVSTAVVQPSNMREVASNEKVSEQVEETIEVPGEVMQEAEMEECTPQDAAVVSRTDCMPVEAVTVETRNEGETNIVQYTSQKQMD